MSRKRMPACVVREVHARSEGVCEAMIPGVCGWRGEHLHHRKLRSQGGEHTTENILFVCARCHDHIHRHTGWAYEQGLLVKGPAEVTWPPVYYRGRRNDEPGSYSMGAFQSPYEEPDGEGHSYCDG